MKKLLLALLLAAPGSRAGGTFVAVDASAVVATPPNAAQLAPSAGTTWTAVSIGTLSVDFDAVAYGNGVFCAVSSTTTTSFRSVDGVTWTAGGLVGGGAAVMAYGNGVFTALLGAAIPPQYNATSPDCVTWTNTGYQPGAVLYSVVFDTVNLNFIGVIGSSGDITSPDGVTWTFNSGVIGGVNARLLASCGGTTLAIGPSSPNVARSTTGGAAAWTALGSVLTTSTTWSSLACSDATHFLVVATNGIVNQTSDAGSTWTQRGGWSTLAMNSLAWNGAQYVVVQPNSAAWGHSADGVTLVKETTGGVALVAPVLTASLTSPPAPTGGGIGNLLLMGEGQ